MAGGPDAAKAVPNGDDRRVAASLLQHGDSWRCRAFLCVLSISLQRSTDERQADCRSWRR